MEINTSKELAAKINLFIKLIEQKPMSSQDLQDNEYRVLYYTNILQCYEFDVERASIDYNIAKEKASKAHIIKLDETILRMKSTGEITQEMVNTDYDQVMEMVMKEASPVYDEVFEQEFYSKIDIHLYSETQETYRH